MPIHVLRYKSVQGRLAPIITVGLKLHENWYPIATCVDSGAAYMLLHAGIAQGAGFNYRACESVPCLQEDKERIRDMRHQP